MGVATLGKDHVWELNLAARAAWMSYIGEMTRAEIANRLGVSPARVHRLIELAREKGMVRISIEGRPSECLEMEDQIARAFGLQSCTISPYLRQEMVTEDIAIASVGQLLAQLLAQHLMQPSVKSVCVGSGRTLLAAMNALPLVPRPDLEIYPAAGSLVDGLAMDPYDVISLLTERTGGRGFQLPIPRYARNKGEAEVFTSQPTVAAALNAARSADVFVCGITSSAQLMGKADHASASNGLIGAAWASEPACLFMGRALDKNGGAIAFDGGASLLGVHFDETRLGQAKGARIFCVAAGESKSTAILAALRAGALTDLVIEEGLAIDLVKALSKGTQA